MPHSEWPVLARMGRTARGSPSPTHHERLEGVRGPGRDDRGLHALHPRLGRAGAAPLHEAVDALPWALRHHLDAAVVQVAHPATHPALLRRADGVFAVKHALHAAPDKDVAGHNSRLRG
ncbi:acylphosphatase [Trypanosoma conorhini]|uniref:Acylphosphatase n=1 Tax=Trypanosoma conorhini TaxID=83891 RepID=A0A422QCY9_9TRYP|nr:acylphosphatase [Trypanosoma conorhini]RNF27736.1 acylphosphatase [Trypanosoma conorhini]